MAQVQLQGISKRFGNVAAVRDVTLTVDDQEFLVLLGPSGCGKTTTLRMVAGLEEPSSGRVFIADRDVTFTEPKDRDIAMVFQNYALYPHMSVFDNMAFGLELRRTPRAEIIARVKEAADMLGIASLLNRRPRELSGGQRQRVALGRAIVRNPKVFLMDEPLSNLDAKLRAQTRVQLKELHQGLNATIIYVTHDQTEAMTMGTRIVVMKDGVVQQVDTPENIYHRPTNQFVATFVGTPAMNLLNGPLHRNGGTLYVDIGRDTRVELSPTLAALCHELARDVTIGVRPEDVYLDQSHDGIRIEATVSVFEPMGHESMVHLSVGDGQSLVVRVNNSLRARVGDRVTATLNPERVHIFDPATERTLTEYNSHRHVV
jgi:multiple sugar transport system ATP-binding protein